MAETKARDELIRKSLKNLLFLAIILLTAKPNVSFAKVITLFDFDNTLTENREEFKGSFLSQVELYRVSRRGNLFQNPLSGPEKIIVTWADYDERLKPYLAKNSDQQGTVGRKVTLTDGRVIEPANYFVRDEDSFKYFYPGEDGTNYLLQDYLKAKKRGKNWIGKAFALFQLATNTPESAAHTGIITMRAHDQKEWSDFWNQLIKDGQINHAPSAKLTFGLPRPENDRHTMQLNLKDRHLAKTFVIEEIIRTLGLVELNPEKDMILNPEGTKKELYHYLLFAEDNQEVLNSVAKLFQRYAQGKQYKIKFALVNTGYQSEVDQSGRPRFAIVEPGGTFRRAKPEEVIGEKKGQMTNVKKCALSLLRLGGKK